MRIFYDGDIFQQKAGGVNRYFASIISRLPEAYQPALLVREEGALNYPAHPKLKVYQSRPPLLRFRPHRLSNWLAQAYQHEVSASRRYDIIHPTYYYLVTPRGFDHFKRPVVLTVYDMIHEIFSETTDPQGQHAEMKRRAILGAQAIICISQSTKRDLLDRYDIPEERVHVTPLASDIDPARSHGPEKAPDSLYFLYVGSRVSYKNFDGLVRAFRRVLSRHPDTTLAVVGLPFTEAENQFLAEQKVADRVEHYGHVGDAHLAKLYRCSVGFVYPSFYEGFGIPPLEAMACGTVAIASDTSSLPEVVGDAGLLFDPYSETALADAMVSLLESPSRRDALIAKGTEKVKEYSWDKTVAQTLDVYRSVC